jgi:elongator complex protein 2
VSVTEGGTQVLGLMTKVQKVEREKITTYYEGDDDEEEVDENKETVGPSTTNTDFTKVQTEDYLVKHTLWPEMNKLYGHPY